MNDKPEDPRRDVTTLGRKNESQPPDPESFAHPPDRDRETGEKPTPEEETHRL